MLNVDDLLQLVDRAFEVTGADTPPWPDPHPERLPDDEEYSRVTNTAKWRIVSARADAWMTAFEEARIAVVEAGPVHWIAEPGIDITRVNIARPHVSGGLPVVFARHAIAGVDDAVVMVGVGDPTVPFTSIPNCGCDACDSGSDDAIEQLDDYVIGIVTGQFRRLTRRDQTVTVISGQVRQSNGTRRAPNIDRVLANPRGWTEITGPSWLLTDPDPTISRP